MKILHVTNAYPSERHPLHGIFVKEQIDSLNTQGVESELFFINAKDFGKWQYIKAIPFILKARNKYDIIHCHHFLVAFLTIILRPKSKVVVSFLSDSTNEFMIGKGPIMEFIKKRMYKFIINGSQGRIFKKEVPEFLKSDPKSVYLPNGVNLDFFKPIDRIEAKKKLGLEPKTRYVLFCSLNNLYRPEKRFDLFKGVMSELKSNADLEDIKELLLINAKREDVNSYFNAAELYILTSDFEGSPNAVKESIAAGTPVVSRNVGDVKRTIGNLPFSFVVDSSNKKDLAEMALKSLTKPSEINKDLYRNHLRDLSLDVNSKAKEMFLFYKKVIQ